MRQKPMVQEGGKGKVAAGCPDSQNLAKLNKANSGSIKRGALYWYFL
jgi:hypothetical protein